MSTIRKVTVLGAGVLGAQIAFHTAYSGFDVVAYDTAPDAVGERFDRLGETYLREAPDADESRVAAARSRLRLTGDLAEAVAEADLVIEAIPERLDLKRTVWGQVGRSAPAGTIFATNTSTLRPSDFAEATGRPERFLALHFANRLWANRIAEVMPTPSTARESFDAVAQFARDIGMEPILLEKEQPGYILNSLLVPFLEAAQRLLVDGVADAGTIDRDWTLATGSPFGPFATMDVIGLRTVVGIARTRGEESGDEHLTRFADQVQRELLDRGHTGRESGEGFFRYDGNGEPIA